MKRFLAIVLGATSVMAVGCGYRSYEMRLEATESKIRDEMTLDRVLEPAAKGDFEKINVFARAPKGWVASSDFAPERRQGDQNLLEDGLAGYFDAKGSFTGPSTGGGPGNDGQPQPAVSGPVLRVLTRRTQQQTDTEKTEAPPVQRGEFQADVRQVLESLYGPEVANAPAEPVSKTIWPRATPPKSASYERWKFNGSNGQLVQVYLMKEKQGSAEYDVALVFEFPDGRAPEASSNPVDLTLGTFAVGNRAAHRFRGNTDDDDGAIDAGGGGAAVAF